MAEVDAQTYIRDYRRTDHFLQFCRQCSNYGRRYGCPPLDQETLDAVNQYRKVRIIGVKIIPNDNTLDIKVATGLMQPVITELNRELLATEQQLGGISFGFVGTCPYCGAEPCARIEGKPCRHSDMVRPSLEAVGFDISQTAHELLGIDIKWSQQGRIPEYLTLVGGIFYDKQ